MSAVGIRVEAEKVHWAVVDGTRTDARLLAHDKFSAPATYDDAETLRWYRDRIQGLIGEYDVTTVAVRYSETFLKAKPKPNTLASMFARARIEGVIVEGAKSAGATVLVGALNTIRAALGSKSVKKYIESDDEFRGIDISSIRNKQRKEAIAAGVSTLPEE